MTGTPVSKPDLWSLLRSFTPARVGITSISGALPTAVLLDLQQGQASARDAVHRAVDYETVAAGIPREYPVLTVHSAARDRAQYIRRPDLGRRLDDNGRALLAARQDRAPYDVAFVIADGLSSAAVMDQAVGTLRACLARLNGWRIAPIVLAEQARVALADEIGAALNSRMSVVLIGERPGISVANSLGAYLTWEPRVGRTDAERNCVSNIHGNGLSWDAAAHSICWLLAAMKARECSGTTLKNEALPVASALAAGSLGHGVHGPQQF